MSAIDWTIVVGSLILLSLFSIGTVRHMQGVSDFLAAGRSGGRYLMSIAQGMSGFGAISAVAMFEVYYAAGFPPVWWTLMHIPVTVIITLSGWVYYRFRESRCLTMAQFFEARYSRPFRIYVGIVTWVCGVVNFGIFPAVAARFFVYFCGMPPSFDLGGVEMPTYIPFMLITLGMALTYTCLGGQVTVMVTDCVQGILTLIILLVAGVFILYTLDWPLLEATLMRAPKNESKLNPFETSGVTDFNVWFYLIHIFGVFYGYMSWQGSQAYQASALSPHEQKMGQVIAIWRQLPLNAMMVLLPIAALAFFHMDDLSPKVVPDDISLENNVSEVESARALLTQIDNETIRTQVTVPVALSYILPIGLKGLFCAVMIFLLITTQDTYLHSWGSIFIQDVILPFRKKPFTPRQHVRLLRYSIGFVALFAFVFSILFKQTEYIQMYMAITGAIVSGAGAVIIGGLYWTRGTSAGAWVAMTIGWVLAIGRIILQQVGAHFEDIPVRGFVLRAMDYLNNTNSQIVWFWIMIICILSYIVVSLLTCRQPANMERLLHRGRYEVAGDHVEAPDAKKSLWWKITGITKEFTRTDRWLAFALVAWNFGWFAVFLMGTLCSLLGWEFSNQAWSRFWKIWLYMHIGIGIPTTIWFSFGGVRDIKMLFTRLTVLVRDASDDGMVRKEPEPES